jgi:hypothetical protein
MRKRFFSLGLLFVVLTVSADPAAAQKPCSTEVVNGTCTLTLDRSYPVNVPTIQVRPGEQVKVIVVNPLPYETLSLDLQSGQALAGTDQTAAFVAAAIPNLKGLLLQTKVNQDTLNTMMTELNQKTPETDPPSVKKWNQDMLALMLTVQMFEKGAITIYSQLNEVLGPLPSPPPEIRIPSDNISVTFPLPWRDYPTWRKWMLCELAGQECPPGSEPSIRALLADGVTIVTALGPCSTPSVAQPQSDTQTQGQPISCQIAKVQTDINAMTDKQRRESLLQTLNLDIAVLNAHSTAITAINKDLGNFFVNIELSKTIPPATLVGEIVDPRDFKHDRNGLIDKFLGRQAVFIVNAVNEVATPTTLVPPASQKKSIVTITVLYADPRFEVSTGALISTLANRSFANQIIVTQNPSGPPTQGNIVITQSISRPTVVVFAGANWRPCHEFLWPDHRRGAFYFTGTVGLNVNNSAAEFGVGPSLSWRSLMFSALYDWGHDVRLTQGEFVGLVWCNVSGPSGSIPKCTGNPPAPSTEKYWRGAFAFGISVRVPTVFTGGH